MKKMLGKTVLIGLMTALILATFASCISEGPAGPTGAQGEKGEQGEKGDTGADGKGIAKIEKTATEGINDIYTITFTDGSTTTFTVTNGAQGDPGTPGIQGDKGDKGDKGDQGDTGAQGDQGDTGVGVVNAYIDENGHLIVVLSNGTELDAGLVGASPAPEVQKYTVTFVDHDGTELKKEVVQEGASGHAPAIPQRAGYVFVGWDKPFHHVTENMTVRAQYQKLEGSTVMVNSTSVKKGDKTVEVVISLLENPGIASMKFGVQYDEALTLQSVVFDPAFGAYVTAPEPYRNPQNISLISPLSDMKASGKMVTLTFEVSQDVNVSDLLSITVQLDAENIFDSNFDSVEFVSINGYVKITE